nr:SDR family NAD(P)-dependent oxidoreductase [Paenibacillus paeoniae]
MQKIDTIGGTTIAVAVNVTQKADVQKLIDTAADTYGMLDILVNNAGYYGQFLSSSRTAGRTVGTRLRRQYDGGNAHKPTILFHCCANAETHRISLAHNKAGRPVIRRAFRLFAYRDYLSSGGCSSSFNFTDFNSPSR